MRQNDPSSLHRELAHGLRCHLGGAASLRDLPRMGAVGHFLRHHVLRLRVHRGRHRCVRPAVLVLLRSIGMMYREDFEGMDCNVPGCTHEDHSGEFYLHSQCHMKKGTRAMYKDGTITITCVI